MILANLKDWVSEFVRLGVTVFFCPIIVSEIIKFKILQKAKKKLQIILLDHELVITYFALLEKFREIFMVTVSYATLMDSVIMRRLPSEISLRSLNIFVFPLQP